MNGNNKIGETIANWGSIVVKLNSPCSEGEKIMAIAIKNSIKSNPSEQIIVQKLPPISCPLMESVIYEGSICIHAWGLIPGSTVRAWNNSELLGRGIAYDSFIRLPLMRPLKSNDAIQLEAEMCGNKSSKTSSIEPVLPFGSGPYAENLPPPIVKGQLFACERVVGVKGLLPGANIKIFADNDIIYDQCTPTIDSSFLLGSELVENQLITAKQAFESLGLESVLSNSVRVGSRKKISPPIIHEPVYECQRNITISNLKKSVKVEISVDDNSIGLADYAGYEEFDLGYQLKPTQKIKARQGLCGVWSPWSNEVIVESSNNRIEPPKIKEPLYPCANSVTIETKLEGSRVKVYADGILIGTNKTYQVSIFPHLLAKQKITATQTLGCSNSSSSPPVIVKDLPEYLPAVEIRDGCCSDTFIDACRPMLSIFKHLLGSRVNVFWNNLLIASGEASDPNDFFRLPISIQPWPGTKLYAIQQLCNLKSKDSDAVTATGKIAVTDLTGYSWPYGRFARPNDILKVEISSQCPVLEDLKVVISSSDNTIFKVLGSNESYVSTGKTKTNFKLEAISPGMAQIKLQANNYEQDAGTSLTGGFWCAPPPFGIGLQQFEVYGSIITDPHEIKVEEEESFDLKITIDPVPADRKINISTKSNHLSVPTQVTIPIGSKTGIVKVKALKAGTDRIYTNRKYYRGWDNVLDLTTCFVTVDPKIEPNQPTSPTIQINLPQESVNFLNYIQTSQNLIQVAKITRIKNLVNHILKIFRYVGNAPVGEPPLDVILQPNEEIITNIQSKDFANGWGAYIKDANLQPENAPDHVSILITYEV